MKKTFLLLLVFTSLCLSAQDATKFRINSKQKNTLLKNGDSNIIILETYLDGNNETLEKMKYPSIPALKDVMPYIESAKESAKKNEKGYKGICIDCYEAEYNNQLKRLEQFGLTDTKGFEVTIVPLFISQDSISIFKSCELILAEAKNTFNYHSTKHNRKEKKCFITFFDESSRGTDQERKIIFVTSVTYTGNPDLEIHGENVYSLAWVEGKFLDFAGFWIKYINPNISLEKLSEKGDIYTYLHNGEKRDIRLVKLIGDNNEWLLRNW